MQRGSLAEATVERLMGHPAEFTGKRVCRHRNNAVASQRRHRNGQTVVAGDHGKSLGTVFQNVCRLRQVAARLLDTDDVSAIVREPQHGLGSHVHAGTARHVIKYDPARRGFGQRLVVTVDSFLRRLIVIRCHRQHGIDPVEIRRTEGRNDIGRRIASEARYHGHTPRASLDDEA